MRHFDIFLPLVILLFYNNKNEGVYDECSKI